MKQVKQRAHTPSDKIADNWSYRLKEEFLRFFGDVKVFGGQPRLFSLSHLFTTFPLRLTLLHDPRSYRVKGGDMRKAMSTLQPGDILVRGFDNYLDGHFIPGFFSHAGLYLGKVDEETIFHHWHHNLASIPQQIGEYAPLHEVLNRTASGEQMVIHSMKDGIFMEDLLDFCRCDYLAALRFPNMVQRAPDITQPYSENDRIKLTFTGEERVIALRLQNGESLPYAEIFPVIFKLALSQLGKEYDFGLDFTSFKKMSCTEFVYYCTKSLEWCSGVRPVEESIAGVRAPGIAPDSFAGSAMLDVAFSSQSVLGTGIIPRIKARYPGPYGTLSR